MQNKELIQYAAYAAIERILNEYFRESNLYQAPPQDNQWSIQLSELETLTGTFRYWSAMGHHLYGPEVWLLDGKSKKLTTYKEAIARILQHMAQSADNQTAVQQHMTQIMSDIDNSIHRTARYLQSSKTDYIEDRYIVSEQSLYLGHPFHPTPKSASGFSEADLERYAPECHTSFQLHYIAVHQDIILSRYVENMENQVATVLHQLAGLDMSELPKDFILLPIHPYQIGVLRQHPQFIQYSEQGLIKDLGVSGDIVYPTSSVRTVFSKALNIYLKLPIHVKITNFIRTNDLEQIERTIDAAQVIASIKDDVETPHFKLMFEEGYRALLPNPLGQSVEPEMDLLTNSAMIVREGIPNYHSEKDIHVLASLFETMPDAPTSKLSLVIEESGLTSEAWLECYLDRTLLPILTLFSNTGISLEAHVQNTLIELNDGIPEVCYVRDLEGICLSTTIAMEKQLIPNVVSTSSPVVYAHDEAWHRLKYYVVVNHLGHLVSTIGKATQNEDELWQLVARRLIDWKEENADNTVFVECVEDLCQSPTIAAKANLMSKLNDCGGNPIYTHIPNPICHNKEVSYCE
ncbi:L-2,3-diaminopropanoate--citrate ligase SbnE [Staphylococcus argenteus]|uniref:L-2,3-diaminopropanoate--citrate ligase SbnE n=1 Tax=Staphylococcus argenteus TaxID=985002 RepID=UPI0005086E78|nr:L-2,3-diaminopropanoate--citrate ligase SbnE [Staphylococcus argenteus]MBE2133288.1 L-2,3-diaminopropanoate--citrate ligase SbnE [Staphylococcus argenteus]MBE2147379.1 L-2,3-diaminopropanoate--citrate ligase SbnE [Staphylococcus argenteus]MBE2160901.1 L-2,3-diaminopropanoate--citrate ligase SbnE [Staphylococcus argenteus]MCG9796989.1 L-2,3-diaminopropanoate--citrate ligase SbnE [Staphylococcus argenteus]MCG9799473.1 L-2,3-diaminopropanoate--citrate ligase SbnE [Staphylococcus argenteus]